MFKAMKTIDKMKHPTTQRDRKFCLAFGPQMRTDVSVNAENIMNFRREISILRELNHVRHSECLANQALT